MKKPEASIIRGQSGFTLVEMLVTIMLLSTVLFALYGIFDMGLRVFSFGNDKLHVTENARGGLERMTRELRAAYPSDKVNGKTNLFWNEGATCAVSDPAQTATPTAHQVTFGNDRNGNRAVMPGSNLGGATDSEEEITYKLSGTNAPYTLERVVYAYNAGAGTCRYASSPLIDNVKVFDLTYLREDGMTALTGSELADSGNESLISYVRINLTLEICRTGVGCSTQNLQTDVALRNRTHA